MMLRFFFNSMMFRVNFNCIVNTTFNLQQENLTVNLLRFDFFKNLKKKFLRHSCVCANKPIEKQHRL